MDRLCTYLRHINDIINHCKVCLMGNEVSQVHLFYSQINLKCIKPTSGINNQLPVPVFFLKSSNQVCVLSSSLTDQEEIK